MSAKIGLFPASGDLGTSVLKHLSHLVPPSLLILVARYPDKLASITAEGATVRRADYDVPETLERAFDGVGVLMLISYPSMSIEHRASSKEAIDAARRSGVKHIIYTSIAFGGELNDTSVAHVMGAHLKTERYLAELPGKFTYTAIREGIYSESFPLYMDWSKISSRKTPSEENEDAMIPHDGNGPGVAWAKLDELGEATAKLVVLYAKNPAAFPYLNKVLLLSGPREVSLKETVETVGRVRGNSTRPARIREISVDEYVSRTSPRIGERVEMSREWATAWEIRRGETAVVTPLLRELLGREPESFETTVRKIYLT